MTLEAELRRLSKELRSAVKVLTWIHEQQVMAWKQREFGPTIEQRVYSLEQIAKIRHGPLNPDAEQPAETPPPTP